MNFRLKKNHSLSFFLFLTKKEFFISMVKNFKPIKNISTMSRLKEEEGEEEKKRSNDEMFTQIPVGRVVLSFDQYLLLFLL